MATKKMCIDSSFWISLLYKHDVLHEEAKKLFLSMAMEDSIILINNFVIEEVTTVLTYKGFLHVVPYFYKILDELNTFYSKLSIEDYKIFFLKLHKKISFTDSSLILDALKYQAKLVTFDEQQEKIFHSI